MARVYKLNWLKCILLLTMVLFMATCGSDSKKNPVNDGDNNNNENNGGNNSNVTSDIWITGNLGVLDSAEARYETLVVTSTPEQAREKLVTELSAKSGVTKAKLFEDGFTIMLKFEDGTYGAVNTLDYKALNASVTNYSTPKSVMRDVIKSQKPLSSLDDVVFDDITSSKKVLFLNVSQPNFPKNSTAIERTKKSFLDAGWDIQDIDVKSRSSRTDTSLKPEDFFDLKEYGVIFIFAEGIYGSFNEGEPSQYYLQLGSSNSLGSAYATMLKDAALKGQIIICDGDFYMRADLLQQALNLPKTSMVFLIGARGTAASSAFLGKTNGHFFGWDDVPLPIDSYNALTNIVKLMGNSNPAKSDAEAYVDNSMVTTSVNTDNRTASFKMIPSHGDMYLPAWLVLKVKGTSVPNNASSFKAGVQINNKTKICDNFASMSGTIDMLSPGRANCFVRANGSDGNLLITATKSDTLNVGKNIVEVDFLKELAPGGSKRIDHENGNQFYPMTADMYSYFIWKKIESIRNYLVITPDGLRMELIQPSGDNLYLRGDYCFDRQQIEQIFGSNFFGMADDELVLASMGTWAYNPDDSDDVKELEEYWANFVKSMNSTTYEVFPY